MSTHRYDHTRLDGGRGVRVEVRGCPFAYVADEGDVEFGDISLTRAEFREWAALVLAALDVADLEHPVEVQS